MRPRLAIACPLPPARSGAAGYLWMLLPELVRHAQVTLLTADPAAAAVPCDGVAAVLPLEERFAPDYDLICYHIGNNTSHSEVNAAALDGPPGLIVVHDASLHHLVAYEQHLHGHHDAYRTLLRAGHGAAGDALADLALERFVGPDSAERFVFDCLTPYLRGHLGVLTHNRYAADVVALRTPWLPCFTVPLASPPVPVAAPRPPAARTARQPAPTSGTLTVGVAGFVTRPKRYGVICDALRLLLDAGHDVRLVLAGQDDSDGDLARTVARLDLSDRVTCTGWLADADFDAVVASFDVALSLRWPHAGESSASLHALLAAGRCVLTEPVGSWADVPHDVAPRAFLGADTAAADLAHALVPLLTEPALRRGYAAAARSYAAAQLSAEAVVAATLDVCRAVIESPEPPVRRLQRRSRRADDALGALDAADALLLRAVPVRDGDGIAVCHGTPAAVRAAVTRRGYAAVLPGATAAGTADVALLWAGARPQALHAAHRSLRPGGLLVTPHPVPPATLTAAGFRARGDHQARKSGPPLGRGRPLLGRVDA